MTFEGEDAAKFFESLKEQNKEIRTRAIALGQTQAVQSGRPPLNVDELKRIIGDMELSPWSEKDLDYVYYVVAPHLNGMQELADYLKEQAFWNR